MRTDKESKQSTIRDSLYYYGIATSQYNVEDDALDGVDGLLYSYQDYENAPLSSKTRVVQPKQWSFRLRSHLLPRLLAAITQGLQQISTGLSGVPLRALWFVFLSMLSLPLGLTLWNQVFYSGYFYSFDLLNGDRKLLESQWQFTEQIGTAESLNEGLLQELQMSSYIIEPGDTLLQLAQKFDLNVDTLVSVNAIEDAVAIRYGQEILVPNRDGILHTVARNESISTIAAKYSMSPNDILDINNISTTTLAQGKQLFIPDVTMDSFELGLVLGTVFLLPARGVLSSGYGYRISPVTGKWHFHRAIDIANKTGTNVLAAATGYVSYINTTNPLYGNLIEITHPNGFKTLYSHLDRIYVRMGQRISRGQRIGLMGNTGMSTGSHLHFAMLKNGKPINPLRYVRF